MLGGNQTIHYKSQDNEVPMALWALCLDRHPMGCWALRHYASEANFIAALYHALRRLAQHEGAESSLVQAYIGKLMRVPQVHH